jgi:hypothetical protein
MIEQAVFPKRQSEEIASWLTPKAISYILLVFFSPLTVQRARGSVLFRCSYGDLARRGTPITPKTAIAIDDKNPSQNQPVRRTAINAEVSANLKRSRFMR